MLEIGPRGSIYQLQEAARGEMVSIPVEEYQRLLGIAEGVSDARTYDAVVNALAATLEVSLYHLD